MRSLRMPAVIDSAAPPAHHIRPLWQRVCWLGAGWTSLALGIIGIFLPLLPTTPFILVAAWCFSLGSPRCEAWLLDHKHFGPMVREWRQYRAVPLRAKQLAWVMMGIGSAWGAYTLPLRWSWLPAVFCLCVGVWLWRLPSSIPSERPERE